MIGQHEGLPNITGDTNGLTGNYYNRIKKGAFIKSSSYNRDEFYAGSSSVRATTNTFTFNAVDGETKADGTLKNDVYGKSDHLQTNNITVKYWKRIA